MVLVLGAALAAAIAAWFLRPGSDQILPEKILGKPLPTNEREELDQLAVDIEFDKQRGRIITRQMDGKILSWNTQSGQSEELEETSSVFAYCTRSASLLFSNDTGATVMRSLKSGETKTISSEPRHHAAWTRDCSRFVLAEETAGRKLEVRDGHTSAVLASALASTEIRNGIAISPDGRFVAAAEGRYDDASGHDTQLEIFNFALDGSLTPVVLIDQQDMVLGMWKMVFAADYLYVGSQTNAKSGLETFVASSGAQIWTKAEFSSYWVRALAVSNDDKLLATGDEKGMFRIWNAETGDKLAEINTGQVIQSASFSEDGKQIAISLKDSTIALYQVGELLGAK